MTSAIDASVPPTGNPTTTAVRAQFATAKSEISDLQLSSEPLTGSGSPRGVVTPTKVGQRYLDTVTKIFYQASGLTTNDWQGGDVAYGALSSVLMAPVLQASANFSVGTQFITDAVGWVAFRATGVLVPSGEAIIVGFSISVSDSAAIKSAIDLVTTLTTGEWDAPTGAQYPNQAWLLTNAPASGWFIWDGVTRIKSIGIEQTNGTLSQALLELVS